RKLCRLGKVASRSQKSAQHGYPALPRIRAHSDSLAKESVVPQKTYWHLLKNQRVPSEYELGSASLLYYVGRGFEIDLPLAEWYRRFPQRSPFSFPPPGKFSVPRKTNSPTYHPLPAP